MCLKLTISKDKPFQLVYGDKIVFGYCDDSTEVSVPVYKMTTIGIQLLNIIKRQTNFEYMKDVEEFIVKDNKGVMFTEHDIIEKLDNGQMRYKISGRKLSVAV